MQTKPHAHKPITQTKPITPATQHQTQTNNPNKSRNTAPLTQPHAQPQTNKATETTTANQPTPKATATAYPETKHSQHLIKAYAHHTKHKQQKSNIAAINT